MSMCRFLYLCMYTLCVLLACSIVSTSALDSTDTGPATTVSSQQRARRDFTFPWELPVPDVLVAPQQSITTHDDNYITRAHVSQQTLKQPVSLSVSCLWSSVVCRLSSVVCRLSSVVCRLSSVVCRLSSVVCRLSSVVYRLSPVVCRLYLPAPCLLSMSATSP
jgi:hypothetical protein